MWFFSYQPFWERTPLCANTRGSELCLNIDLQHLLLLTHLLTHTTHSFLNHLSLIRYGSYMPPRSGLVGRPAFFTISEYVSTTCLFRLRRYPLISRGCCLLSNGSLGITLYFQDWLVGVSLCLMVSHPCPPLCSWCPRVRGGIRHPCQKVSRFLPAVLL